jgi:hypothetical protein
MSEFNGTVILPSEDNVQSGVMYGTSGIQFTGNITVPNITQVVDGVGFGASGIEFIGIL